MSTQENSVQQDPEITLDTDVQFDVSDSTDLNPQTVEYSQAKDDVQSLEAYQALLRTAREGISAQTQAVLNTHLAQIDNRLGRATQYGLEAFAIGHRAAIRKGTITLEAIQDRLTQARGQLYRFNTHEVLMMAFEEVAESGDESRLQKFMAWLEKIWTWLKEKFSGVDAKLEKLDARAEATKQEVLDTLTVSEYDGKQYTSDLDLTAATYDGTLNLDLAAEAPVVDWLTGEFMPWVVSIQTDIADMLHAQHPMPKPPVFETALLAKMNEWRNNAPSFDIKLGGGCQLTFNEKTLEVAVSIEDAGEPSTELKIRPLAERKKQTDLADSTGEWHSKWLRARQDYEGAVKKVNAACRTTDLVPAGATAMSECLSMAHSLLGGKSLTAAMKVMAQVTHSRQLKLDALEEEGTAIRKLARDAGRATQKDQDTPAQETFGDIADLRQLSDIWVSVENEGGSKASKFREWFKRFVEWLKDIGVKLMSMAEGLKKKQETVAEKVKEVVAEDRKNAGALKEAVGKPVKQTEDISAWSTYDGEVDAGLERELEAIQWVHSTYLPWAKTVLTECHSLMEKSDKVLDTEKFAAEFNAARDQWLAKVPKEKILLGNNKIVHVDPETMNLTITASEKTSGDFNVVIREARTWQQQVELGGKIALFDFDTVNEYTDLRKIDAAFGDWPMPTDHMDEINENQGLVFEASGALMLARLPNVLKGITDSYSKKLDLVQIEMDEAGVGKERASTEGLIDWIGDTIRNVVKGKKMFLNISHQRELAKKLKESYMNPGYLKSRRITGDVFEGKMPKWIAEGKIAEAQKRVGAFKSVAQREQKKTQADLKKVKPFVDYLFSKAWLNDQSKLADMANKCPNKTETQYDLDFDGAVDGIGHVPGKVGPLDEKGVIQYATALHDITVMLYTNFETIVGKEWEDIYIVERNGQFHDRMGPDNEFLAAAKQKWGEDDQNYALVRKLCHSIYLYGKWTEQNIMDADSPAVHLYFTTAIAIEDILDKAVA